VQSGVLSRSMFCTVRWQLELAAAHIAAWCPSDDSTTALHSPFHVWVCCVTHMGKIFSSSGYVGSYILHTANALVGPTFRCCGLFGAVPEGAVVTGINISRHTASGCHLQIYITDKTSKHGRLVVLRHGFVNSLGMFTYFYYVLMFMVYTATVSVP